MPVRVHRRPVDCVPEADSGAISVKLSSWCLAPSCISSFMLDSRPSNLLVMCAEPGMGQSSVLKTFISHQKHQFTTHFLHFFGMEPHAASKRLSRLARQIEKECLADKKVFVALDDVPAGDEAIVDRSACALSRMVECGAVVAVSVLPEDALLAERLPEGVRVVSSDLLVTEALELSPSDSLYDVRAFTGGIPALVGAVARDNGDPHAHSVIIGSSYFDALEHLIGESLRQSLLDEEILVRLAMILLGQGTFAEIAGVTCLNPNEIALGLEEFAPLFGVCCQDGSFHTFGVDSVDGLVACSSVLATKISSFSFVFDSALRVLMRRGEYSRAAVIARLATSDEAAVAVIDNAEDFVSAGEASLVRKAVGLALSRSLASEERLTCLQTVLGALGDSRARNPEDRVLLHSSDGDCPDEIKGTDCLLVGCRSVLAGEDVKVDVTPKGQPAALAIHLQAVQLMRDGQISAAQRLAGPHVLSCSEGTLASVLLRLDMSLASALLGDDQPFGDDAVAKIHDFLAREGFAAIRDEANLLLAIDAILHGSYDLASIDALVRESERAGNELVRVAALLAGAAAEYMAGDIRSAGLRSAIASSAAGRAGFYHLEAEAGILCQAAMSMGVGTGSTTPGWEVACGTQGLSILVDLVRAALDEGDERAQGIQRSLVNATLPINELWLLRVLVSGEGSFQGRVRRLIPHAWAGALAPITSTRRTRCFVRRTGGSLDDEGGKDAKDVASGPRLRLSLLGGFSLQVDGETIPEWRLDRRCAKAMLVFVALHPRLLARRYEIIDQVWPDCDYKAGLDRIYQATSALRKAVTEVTPDLNPFLAFREDKSVSLDPALFECDFEEFTDAAKEALECEGDDARTLEAALRAERLYAGDLFVPSRDFTGYVVARRQELRELYADAMVAGAEAALRLERYRVSARLTDSATAVDDLREDAVEVLIRALRASGRMFEAEQRYKKYAVHFVDRTHMPPSKRLRKAIGEGSRGGADRPASSRQR